jgi:hypothetical protein
VVTLSLIVLPTQAQVAGFSDIPSNHWAAESVSKLVSAHILAGPPTKKAAKTTAKYDGDKPVTRYELAVTLYRFVLVLDRAGKQKKSKMGADISGPNAVKYLVDKGYLPKDSPLTTDGSKVVTANQLADTMSQVIAKIKENSIPITPGSKFAPN